MTVLHGTFAGRLYLTSGVELHGDTGPDSVPARVFYLSLNEGERYCFDMEDIEALKGMLDSMKYKDRRVRDRRK